MMICVGLQQQSSGYADDVVTNWQQVEWFCLRFSFLSTCYQIIVKWYGYVMLFVTELHGYLEELSPSYVNIKQHQFQT